MSNNIKLLCLFLKAQNINKSSEQGYAMAIVSMLSIITFSLLSDRLMLSKRAVIETIIEQLKNISQIEHSSTSKFQLSLE